jgi:excisionase family DNA binding protein
MEILTFDQLPKAVSELLEKVSKIETLLNQDHHDDKEADGRFSVQEAAAFLNLSVSTIYGKVCRREIPVSKKGKLYFNKAELIEWIDNGRKSTLAEVASSVSLIRGRRR